MRAKALYNLLFCLLLTSVCFAVTDISEFEKYQEKEYGPEYFRPIEGEIFGQAAPGVEAVYVNGQAVPVSTDRIFATKVLLKEGQKYLTIDTKYKGLRFIKKYLVIRHPKVTQPLKIRVPEKEFEKIIAKKEPPAPKKKERPKRKYIRPPKPKLKKKEVMPIIEKWLGFEFVAQLKWDKFLVVRKVDGKYFSSVCDTKTGIWLPLQELSSQEFKDLLEKGKIPASFDP